MKRTKQILHEECKNCERLRTLSVYMDGSAYYSCGSTPNHVEKDRHKTPCNKYLATDCYYVIHDKKVMYQRFYGEDGYVSSVHYAKHFNTKEEAEQNIPNDGSDWEVLCVDWLEKQVKYR